MTFASISALITEDDETSRRDGGISVHAAVKAVFRLRTADNISPLTATNIKIDFFYSFSSIGLLIQESAPRFTLRIITYSASLRKSPVFCDAEQISFLPASTVCIDCPLTSL